MTSEVDDCMTGDETEFSENDQNITLDSIRRQVDFSSKVLLVTGGAGYIGSHTVIELILAGFNDIVIVDNYINSCPKAIDRMKTILNDEIKNNKIDSYKLTVYNCDLAENDASKIHEMCKKHQFFACLHFAGLKAVGESVAKPLEYYHNNLNSTLNLLRILPLYNCNNFIFSSSATVYGTEKSPITEKSDTGRGISNPYGFTKFFVEQILHDTANANPDLNAVILRYFNPIGAHPSGLIGNDPRIPNNLMPYLLQVAVKRRPFLNVFGNDYNTHDGTGVRDYIHIVDIARGHVRALEMDVIPRWLKKQDLKTRDSMNNSVSAYNLGTGKGSSVLDMIHSLEKACGHKIPYKVMGRRPGDLDTLYADCSLAKKKLGWEAEYNADDACRDAWRWQSNNPMGYEDDSIENNNKNKNNNNSDDSDDKTINNNKNNNNNKKQYNTNTDINTNTNTNTNTNNITKNNMNSNKINNTNNQHNENIFDFKRIMILSLLLLIIAIAAYAILQAINVAI